MKKLKFALLFAVIYSLPSMAQVPIPVPGWPQIFNKPNYLAEYAVMSMAIENGELVLFYNSPLGEVDKFQIDGSPFPGWPITFDTLLFYRSPTVVDIDHDDRNEIVTIGDRVDTNRRYLYSLVLVIDDNATIMPGWPITVRWPSLNVADMDDDNEYEIICYSNLADTIYCFDFAGNSKPGWPVPFHLPGVEEGYTPMQGSIGDLDLDGRNEFILPGAWDILAFRYDGTRQPGFSINLQDTTYLFYNAWQSPSLADLDADGYLEIITSGNNWSVFNPTDFTSFVAIYDNNGIMENGWPLNLNNKMIVNAIVPSDINGDGVLEICIKSGDFESVSLTFLEFNGESLPGWPSTAIFPTNDDIIMVDVDGDRNCEIFGDNNVLYHDANGSYSLLYGMDHMGQLLPDYPIRTRGSFIGLPPTFALDQTSRRLYLGLAEVVSYSFDEDDSLFLELFQFPDSTGPTDQWPMKSHDNLRTRNYNFVDRVTSIADEGPAPLPKSIILKQNYPNPFNSRTTIDYTLPAASDVAIDLFDISGRKIQELFSGHKNAGEHTAVWDATDAASGVYFYRLKANKYTATRKCILIK